MTFRGIQPYLPLVIPSYLPSLPLLSSRGILVSLVFPLESDLVQFGEHVYFLDGRIIARIVGS
jgi:hypothetical protein